MSAEICLYCGMPEDSEHTDLCSFPRERDEIEHQRRQVDGAEIDAAVELEARLAAARKLLAEHGEVARVEARLARAEAANEDFLRGLSVLGRVQNIVAAATHDCSMRVDLLALLESEPLAQAAPPRPWTYCVDGLPATARRYEAAVVVTSPTPHLDRRFLEWFVGRDGSQGWLGELDCIAYAWREMLPTEELPAPRRRDLTEWPSLGSLLDTLAP